MTRRYIIFALVMISLKSLAGDPKYSASTITEELKSGMYAVIRENDERFYIDSKNRSHYHVRKVTTILNPKGKKYAIVQVDYDKLRKIETLKANVYDAQGILIKRLKPNDFIDQSAISGYSLYEDNRVKYADLSQTVYPYTVEFEYEVSIRYLYDIPDFYLYLDDEVSLQNASYAITFPKDLEPRYKLFNIADPKRVDEPDKRTTFLWNFENVKPNKFEKFSPDYYKVVPNIRLAPVSFEFEGYPGKMTSWAEYGAWQALLNNGRDVLSEGTKQEIRTLTKDLRTTEEKARAVYAYLQARTRYVSIQLGIGGFQPFEAKVVDETGYGDCKALSNYTVALLKEAGVKGYYCTIRAGANAMGVDVDFPSDQSNHIIVAVPNQMDTLWLECTSQTNPFGYLGTFTGDRKALMVTDNGGSLVHTIRYAAEQNSQFRTADVYLQVNGDAKASVKTTYSGTQYENGGLNFVINNKGDDQRKWLQENTGIPSFDIEKFSMTDYKDKLPSARIDVNFSLRRLATVSGKRIFLTPNLMNRSTYIPEKITARKNEVVRHSAYYDIDTIIYHLPEEIYPEFLPDPVNIASRFGEYEARFTLEQGKLLYVRKIKINKGQFPAESYEELIQFYRNLNKADNIKLVFLNKT